MPLRSGVPRSEAGCDVVFELSLNRLFALGQVPVVSRVDLGRRCGFEKVGGGAFLPTTYTTRGSSVRGTFALIHALLGRSPTRARSAEPSFGVPATPSVAPPRFVVTSLALATESSLPLLALQQPGTRLAAPGAVDHARLLDRPQPDRRPCCLATSPRGRQRAVGQARLRRHGCRDVRIRRVPTARADRPSSRDRAASTLPEPEERACSCCPAL